MRTSILGTERTAGVLEKLSSLGGCGIVWRLVGRVAREGFTQSKIQLLMGGSKAHKTRPTALI